MPTRPRPPASTTRSTSTCRKRPDQGRRHHLGHRLAPYDAAKIQPYGYDRYPNVITSVEFERMADPFGPTGGKLLRPSDGKEAKNVAFIQCAGSRDRKPPRALLAHLLHGLAEADHLRAREAGDDAKSTIYYIDIRAIDRFEDFYQKVQATRT
jgi:quinone-modifying oxidoreductase, subunit QmoA